MKGFILGLMMVTGLSEAQTVNVPINVSVTPTTVTVIVGGSTTTIPVPVVQPPPPPPQPPTGVTWVYHAGQFTWGGDWSWQATINYNDTAGGPTAGATDVSVTVNNGGGWQPVVNTNCQQNTSLCFNAAGFNFMLLQLKPTQANQVWAVGFESSGDTPDGPQLLDISQYCSGGKNPPIGVWDVCRIPMTAFGLTNPLVLKFSVQDRTNKAANKFYAQEVGFSAT